MQVHGHCAEVGLTQEEREMRRQALYITSLACKGRAKLSQGPLASLTLQVHRYCTEVGLTEEEREVRRQALYIIDNLNLVNLAMRLCDFKDIHMAVEAKQVRITCISVLDALMCSLSCVLDLAQMSKQSCLSPFQGPRRWCPESLLLVHHDCNCS